MSKPSSLEVILQTALEIPGLEDRDAYLDEACGGDRALREDAASLVHAHFAAEAFMDSPPAPLWQEPGREMAHTRIGRYQLLKTIGEGGFGTVYLAEQGEPMRRQVALKIIKPGMDTREIIRRFETERQVLAMMDHPHIAKVHDAGTTENGRPYFVMELVGGEPVTGYCAAHRLNLSERLEIFIDVCAAVQHAHQKGIIHRDLKPSNILVSSNNGRPEAKVIDFGIAKAIGTEPGGNTVFTQIGRMIGTPQYMSPEQADPHTHGVDTRSDIYSLGAILYELLTGTTPLDGKRLRESTYAEMLRLIREETPSKPSTMHADAPAGSATYDRPAISPRTLRGDLDWIVLKALEKDPGRRYESAGALAEDLVRFLQHKPVEARPPSVSYLIARFTRRHRGPVIAAAALVLALVLGAVGTTVGMKRALDAKRQLESKNRELDQQKLTLVDYKERLAGLLDSNQRMLGEISRMSTAEAPLPVEFEALRRENQNLLDKVKSEVANQERYTEEIDRLERTNAELKKLTDQQRKADADLKRGNKQLQTQLAGLQRTISMINRRPVVADPETADLTKAIPFDRKTGGVTAPHTVVSLTSDQMEEVQTLGSLTLTPEQWQTVRAKWPQSPKRFDTIIPVPLPDPPPTVADASVIELSRGRVAVLHGGDTPVSIESVRAGLFKDSITSIRMNDRGQIYLDGKLIPYPTLLKALATPPDNARRDEEGKLVATVDDDGRETTVPRWLAVKLPAGAQATDDVFHSRLKQIAAAADQLGLRHGLFAEER